MTKKLLQFLYNHRLMFIFGICLTVILLIPESCYADLIESYSDSNYEEKCNFEEIEKKYSAESCWSCDIISIMTQAMTSVISAISGATITLARIILLAGAAVWLAAYFLKSLSSFAAQDPQKVLDGAFTFMFKVALMYVLIEKCGFEFMVNRIVNPILEIGIEIGTAFIFS